MNRSACLLAAGLRSQRPPSAVGLIMSALEYEGRKKKSAGSGDACTERALVFQQPCRPAGCHLARLLSFRPPLGVFLRLPIPAKVAAQ